MIGVKMPGKIGFPRRGRSRNLLGKAISLGTICCSLIVEMYEGEGQGSSILNTHKTGYNKNKWTETGLLRESF